MGSNSGALHTIITKTQGGEFLIMTHKGEDEASLNNNRSFPHWDNLYADEAKVYVHFHGTTKILMMI